MAIYRKIYEQHYGPIPNDDEGRTYDIHHIDGNHKNDNPKNLRALSKKDHYDVHYSQGDWGACMLIADSLKLSPAEISSLATRNHQKRISDGTHPFLGGDVAKETSRRRVKENTHNFLGGQIQRETAQRRVSDGTHHWLSGDLQRISTRRRLEEGTHPFKIEWVCEHCGKTGKNTAMYNRWHNGKCKLAK
jgi:hypothetical protein